MVVLLAKIRRIAYQEYDDGTYKPVFSSVQNVSFWQRIAELPSVTLTDLHKLAAAFPDGESAWNAAREELQRAGLRAARSAAVLHERTTAPDSAAPYTVVDRDDPAYPRALAHTAKPPVVLYYRGKRPRAGVRAIAVVGTRRPSAYGRLMVHELIPPLVEAGFTIISGLAYGIDAIVHRATLNAGGITWAVLGNGIDRITPLGNASLGRSIIANRGTVLAEFRPGTDPHPAHFPLRNRIIAGLATATLVIEAPERSGALITARDALDENREVFAVPHDVVRESGRGTNALIRAGAHVATKATDVLDTLGVSAPPVVPDAQPSNLSDPQRQLLDLLKQRPQSIDECVDALPYRPEDITTALQLLVLQGLIRQLGGQQYALVGRRQPGVSTS